MPTAIDSLYDVSLTLRLLCAKNAPLVLGFLNDAFKERNQHIIGEEELELLLERHLADHIVLDGEIPAENRAKNYLNLWCSDEYCYVRKRFDEEQQCFVYQLTRHSEKTLQWLRELQTGERLGHTTTESRFSRIFSEMQARPANQGGPGEPIIKAKLPAEMIAEIRERLSGEPKTETESSSDANGSTSA